MAVKEEIIRQSTRLTNRIKCKCIADKHKALKKDKVYHVGEKVFDILKAKKLVVAVD